jgi:hypothetical protein
MLIGTFNGRLVSFGVVKLVVVVISDKLCFEMVNFRKWVCNTANNNHRKLQVVKDLGTKVAAFG